MGIKYSIRIRKKKQKTLTNKMKFAFSLLALAAAQDTNDNTPDDEWQGAGTGNAVAGPRSGAGGVEDADRRYDDLEKIAKKYWNKQGMTGKNKFDDRDYWAYGCHCFLLGDRPMSAMGKGSPVDALDNRCKAYKDCQKCVREKHGDDCIGEMVSYQWRWNSKLGQLQGRDAHGSCSRELMECDKKFVEDTFDNKDVFSYEYHAFYAEQNGFPAWDNEDDASCRTGGNAPVDHECCGGGKTYYTWMNTNTQECCARDGKDQAVNIGQC